MGLVVSVADILGRCDKHRRKSKPYYVAEMRRSIGETYELRFGDYSRWKQVACIGKTREQTASVDRQRPFVKRVFENTLCVYIRYIKDGLNGVRIFYCRTEVL